MLPRTRVLDRGREWQHRRLDIVHNERTLADDDDLARFWQC